MQSWPDWFIEALKKRFHELSLAAKQDNGSFLNLEQLKENVGSSIHSILNEYEDTLVHEYSKQLEWVYFEGVKDGIRLIRLT